MVQSDIRQRRAAAGKFGEREARTARPVHEKVAAVVIAEKAIFAMAESV